MIQLIHSTDINKEKWDALVYNANNPSLFGYSWYLDAALPGWSAFVYDDYKAGIIFPLRKKMRIAYAYNPLFVRECGIFSSSPLPDPLRIEFARILSSAARLIHLYTFDPIQGFTCNDRSCQWLAMSKNQQQITNGYNENTKRNIKKSVHSGHSVLFNHDYQTVLAMFEQNKLHEIDNLKRKDMQTLSNIMQATLSRASGFAAHVYNNDVCIASGFFIRHARILLYLKGAASPEGKKTGAMHRLIHETLMAEHGTVNYVDFGGSNLPSVARFYKGFGASDFHYSACRHTIRLTKFRKT